MVRISMAGMKKIAWSLLIMSKVTVFATQVYRPAACPSVCSAGWLARRTQLITYTDMLFKRMHQQYQLHHREALPILPEPDVAVHTGVRIHTDCATNPRLCSTLMTAAGLWLCVCTVCPLATDVPQRGVSQHISVGGEEGWCRMTTRQWLQWSQGGWCRAPASAGNACEVEALSMCGGGMNRFCNICPSSGAEQRGHGAVSGGDGGGDGVDGGGGGNGAEWGQSSCHSWHVARLAGTDSTGGGVCVKAVCPSFASLRALAAAAVLLVSPAATTPAAAAAAPTGAADAEHGLLAFAVTQFWGDRFILWVSSQAYDRGGSHLTGVRVEDVPLISCAFHHNSDGLHGHCPWNHNISVCAARPLCCQGPSELGQRQPSPMNMPLWHGPRWQRLVASEVGRLTGQSSASWHTSKKIRGLAWDGGSGDDAALTNREVQLASSALHTTVPSTFMPCTSLGKVTTEVCTSSLFLDERQLGWAHRWQSAHVSPGCPLGTGQVSDSDGFLKRLWDPSLLIQHWPHLPPWMTLRLPAVLRQDFSTTACWGYKAKHVERSPRKHRYKSEG